MATSWTLRSVCQVGCSTWNGSCGTSRCSSRYSFAGHSWCFHFLARLECSLWSLLVPRPPGRRWQIFWLGDVYDPWVSPSGSAPWSKTSCPRRGGILQGALGRRLWRVTRQIGAGPNWGSLPQPLPHRSAVQVKKVFHNWGILVHLCIE